jgi:hemoglobin-like flavoprotein
MPSISELSAEDVSRVRDGFDLIWPVSDRTVEMFYDRLFEAQPDLRALFGRDMAEQKRKFIATLAAIVAHLDDKKARFSITGTLGQHHGAYGVVPGHYVLVREALMSTLAQTLGPAWTVEAATSWQRAYDCVSAEMQEASAV